MSAVKAMREAGLPIDVETAYRKLEEIANERGPDDTRHFDTLLERLGLKCNPEVIAAGVGTYRATSPVYLTPFPEAVPILLKLRDAGYKLGVASKGRAVKQWQKLIQLGLEHLFHAVTVSEETGQEQFTTEVLSRTLDKLAVKREEAVFMGCDLAHEIAVANAAKMITVRIRTGADRTSRPRDAGEKPAYEIGKISEVFEYFMVLELLTGLLLPGSIRDYLFRHLALGAIGSIRSGGQ
jgi:putative hydrolase of the HAD superfamily